MSQKPLFVTFEGGEGAGKTTLIDKILRALQARSLQVITAKLEPGLKDAKPELRYQFERIGYFTLDKDSSSQKSIFNRTITLKDTWAKEAQKDGQRIRWL